MCFVLQIRFFFADKRSKIKGRFEYFQIRFEKNLLFFADK